MEIAAPVKERDITDYDFMFLSGSKLTVALDEQAGDKIEELSDRYVLEIASKPSLTDPEELSDAETMQVFKAGLAAVCLCRRKQRMPSEDELFEMQATLHKLAKSIQ